MCTAVVDERDHDHHRSKFRSKALIFFRPLLSSCLSWKIYCDDHLFHQQNSIENNDPIKCPHILGILKIGLNNVCFRYIVALRRHVQ